MTRRSFQANLVSLLSLCWLLIPSILTTFSVPLILHMAHGIAFLRGLQALVTVPPTSSLDQTSSQNTALKLKAELVSCSMVPFFLARRINSAWHFPPFYPCPCCPAHSKFPFEGCLYLQKPEQEWRTPGMQPLERGTKYLTIRRSSAFSILSNIYF